MTSRPGCLYDPHASYDLKEQDIEYRRGEDGPLLARVYQPQGKGPFPAILDVHGGAWYRGDRINAAHMHRTLASSGIVVAAIDFRLSPQYAYPAQVQDTNYGCRWLKAHASQFNADPNFVGGMGSSSGGNTVALSAMRPTDPRYCALSLPETPQVNATMAFLLLCWGVLDPFARYQFALETGRDRLCKATEGYFLTEDNMKDGSPQHMLEQGEKAHLPPALIVQGTNDDNVPQAIPTRFAESYRAAGGTIELEWFPGMPHGFGREPGPESDRALGLMKDFVARQLAALAAPV